MAIISAIQIRQPVFISIKPKALQQLDDFLTHVNG
jgi:hypothetical protein